jgi:hypothetical protein
MDVFRAILAYFILKLSPSQERLDAARRILFTHARAQDLSNRDHDYTAADLMWIVNHHAEVPVIKAALQRLPYDDQTLLGIVATTHELDEVRACAIGIHRDQRLKVRLCLGDPSKLVRAAAFKGISAIPHLEEISRSSFPDMRIAYLEHMGTLAPRLHLMSGSDPDATVRETAYRIIKEQLKAQRVESAKKTTEHYAQVISITTAAKKPN